MGWLAGGEIESDIRWFRLLVGDLTCLISDEIDCLVMVYSNKVMMDHMAWLVLH